MTIAGDFVSGEGQENTGGSNYPSIFGIQLAPPVIGALIAVLGLGAAVYLFISFVKPALEKNNQIKTEIGDKKNQLEELRAIQNKIAKANERNKEVKRQLGTVTALFANDKSVNTLLLDLNKRIEGRNNNLAEERIRARLVKFEPDIQNSGIVNDGSLGLQLNGKISRQVYNVQMEGTFDQVRLFLIELERQKSLSIVKDLKSVLAESVQKIAVDQQDGKIVPIGNPETKISTSFKLQVVRPLSAEEQVKLAPPPTATPSPGATPAPAK